MKNILIALLVIVIISQSFSLHKCRNDVKLTYFLNGNKVLERVINGNTTIDRIRSPYVTRGHFYGKTYEHNELQITGGNP